MKIWDPNLVIFTRNVKICQPIIFFLSLQLILMKTRLFTRSGMIIRAVKLIFYLNEKKGRSMRSLNMSGLDDLCSLEQQ